MGEQMYVIAKMEEALTAPLVPESELNRRLALAKDELTREVPDYDEAIDILLHGEPDVLDPITHQVPLPVTEEPTRKEWEDALTLCIKAIELIHPVLKSMAICLAALEAVPPA